MTMTIPTNLTYRDTTPIANAGALAVELTEHRSDGSFILGTVEQTPCGRYAAFTLQRQLLLDPDGYMHLFNTIIGAGEALRDPSVYQLSPRWTT